MGGFIRPLIFWPTKSTIRWQRSKRPMNVRSRHVERRATGRKLASSARVVRGSVRVVAASASQFLPICTTSLRLTDVQAWRSLRQQLQYRHEARRLQLRFRRDPDAYLATLEQRLITPSLPS